MENKTELKVKINKKDAYDYPVIIGENLLEHAQKYIKNYTEANRLLVVTNNTIYDIYKDAINIENAEILVLEDGEQYKNFYTYKLILDKTLEMKLERKDAIVAFGGGVIGDMAGFCAATYLRGIDFVQIPTTLLAQVDSSVGGKVAINTAFGKNLVGAFYQPKLVLADTNVLKTLDERQFKTGLSEVVKYAFIEKTAVANHNFYKFLSENVEKIKNREPEVLQKMIKICCEIKAAVVNKDEKETGLRAILNFGHTYAHAIEKVTNYNYFTHGEAVAIGMKMAFELALREKHIDEKYYNMAMTLLEQYDLNYTLPESATKQNLITAMAFDKKVLDKKVRFILPTDLGKVKIVDNIEPQKAIF